VLEWDPEKAEANRRKHGVDFADAATALSDEHALTRADDEPGEERFLTLGMDALGRILLVVYSWRGDLIRLISARKASPSERKIKQRFFCKSSGRPFGSLSVDLFWSLRSTQFGVGCSSPV